MADLNSALVSSGTSKHRAPTLTFALRMLSKVLFERVNARLVDGAQHVQRVPVVKPQLVSVSSILRRPVSESLQPR